LSKLICILIVSLLSLGAFAFDMRVVTEASYNKIINGDAGVELLIKSTIGLTDGIDLKLGMSEGYTALRGSKMDFNHAGTRMDIGVLWSIADFKVGYTHSSRKWFEDANPRSVFLYDSVDKFSVRKEFDIKL